MRLPQTKAQGIVNTLWGYGKFIVRSQRDIDILAKHLTRILPRLLDEKYAEALIRFVQGDPVEGYQIQLKHHGLANLRVAIRLLEDSEPKGLPTPNMEKEEWTPEDLSDLLFGVPPDPKFWRLDFPQPGNGSTYTLDEVRAILEELNAYGDDE